jgi:hypothetical protein
VPTPEPFQLGGEGRPIFAVTGWLGAGARSVSRRPRGIGSPCSSRRGCPHPSAGDDDRQPWHRGDHPRPRSCRRNGCAARSGCKPPHDHVEAIMRLQCVVRRGQRARPSCSPALKPVKSRARGGSAAPVHVVGRSVLTPSMVRGSEQMRWTRCPTSGKALLEAVDDVCSGMSRPRRWSRGLRLRRRVRLFRRGDSGSSVDIVLGTRAQASSIVRIWFDSRLVAAVRVLRSRWATAAVVEDAPLFQDRFGEVYPGRSCSVSPSSEDFIGTLKPCFGA